MPTTYKDQFFRVDPGNRPATGTPLTVERGTFIDFNDNGQLNSGPSDTFNGIAITAVWRNDTLTINVPGVGNIRYTGTTFYLASGAPVFTPTDGQVLRNGTFRGSTFVNTSTNMPVGTFGPTCFTRGAMIDVPGGTRSVEDIAVGDLVQTLDHGAQAVRLVLRQSVRAQGSFAPVRFAEGSIGNARAFMVSPEHRMLISDWRAQLFTGCDDLLVAAKHLVNGDGVHIVEGGVIEYLHLVFDTHEIIIADGCPSESCLPQSALGLQDTAHRTELMALFPDLSDLEGSARCARRIAAHREAICMLAA